MAKADFTVTFWGVRGSRPVPGLDTAFYGGNTPCVQVQIGERLLILDAGTGISNLGDSLCQTQNQPIKGEIFITHTHWDHIQGFPFFSPAFKKGNSFTLYGIGSMNLSFAEIIRRQMDIPYFPIRLEDLNAEITFQEIHPDETLHLGDGVIIKTLLNNHPNGGVAYRIEYAGKVCCYLTDMEHHNEINENLLNFIKNANLVIYDSNFTDSEYLGLDGNENRIGWGHSTWQEGVKLMLASGGEQLVLFHHHTMRTDAEMAKIEKMVKEAYPNSCAAREGMVIKL